MPADAQHSDAQPSCPPQLHRPVTQLPQAAAVLDCDGVLVTSEEAWTRAYHELAHDHHVVLTPADRASLRGLDMAGVASRLPVLLDAPPEAGPRLATAALELFKHHVQACLAPVPGAIELLTALTATRPVVIVSNAPKSTVEDHLARCFSHALLGQVRAIITADAVMPPKPDPALYRSACAVLGVQPSKAVAVEDSPPGGRSALSAGLHLVAAPGPDSVWSEPACLTVSTLQRASLWIALGLRAGGEGTQRAERG